MTLSASACATLTRAAQASETADSAFCARWPDKDRPPVWIEDGDSVREAEAKIDLLIVWEVACGIER